MRKTILFSLVIIVSFSTLAQNVGIGTTSPTSKLHVKGTGSGTQIVLEENAGSILRISNEPSGTGPYVGTTTNNPLSLVTNNAVRVSISSAGNVGIGQSSPTSPLHFANTLGNKIVLWGTSANHYGIGIQSLQMQFYTSAATDDIVFGYGNSAAFTENMRIRGNGNVGIGTTNPQQMLSVADGMVIDQDNTNTGTTTNSLRFGSNSGEAIGSKRTAGTGQYGLDFYTNDIKRMTIANSGNVGINTLNPQTTLDVNGDLNIANKLLLNNSTGNNGQVLVSNGNAVAPQWKDVAYSNNDRFYYTVKLNQIVNAGIFNDTIQYDTYYANSSAISYSSTGIFTVNKTGLYNINASFLPGAYCSTASESPIAVIIYNIKYPAASLSQQTLYYGKIDYISPISGSSFFVSTYDKEWKVHMVAGTQFYFVGAFISSFITIASGFNPGTELSINLISE